MNKYTTLKKNQMKYVFISGVLLVTAIVLSSYVKKDAENINNSKIWYTDFLDEFETFNENNWQDQRIWGKQ